MDWPPSAVLQEYPPHSTVHNNSVVILQSWVFASFFPSKSSLSFKLGQGNYALSGQQGTWVFFWGRRHSPSLYMPAGPKCTKTRKISLNSSSRFFFLPNYQLLPRVYEIEFPVAHVPSIRDTISFCILPPFSRLPYSASSLPFHPPNKIFSALVFKSNIFMVDGFPTTVRFPQLSLKNCQSLSSSNDRWLGAVKSSKFFP